MTSPEPLKRILVIEDDEDILFAVTQLLELEGYEVSTATNGAIALDLLQQNELPDLILLDMIMPVMDGWKFAAALHQKFGTCIPVLVMTAAANAAERARDVGAAGWVPKPFKIEELIERIKEHSNGRKS
ncbi:MAG: hypothetical protein A2X94_00525 [Bdellovibrionales bacterium GWB1_55_8]|nr:MAG: hypothetical protein A2X94_00525 [Bdellovibrionales bacterium GWB1_55_8]